MSRFIQIHILTSYPPANLNRDDMGRPKTAKMGGVDRLRISSQSLKRAWRTSDLFQSALKDHIGTRTKELGKEIYKQLIAKEIKPKDAKKWSRSIAGVFGSLKPENKNDIESLDDLCIEQLVHISPEERTAVKNLVETLIAEKREPTKEDLNLFRYNQTAVDIALFGRMIAANPPFNVEAACQISHAISVHPVIIEDDYFTAVDDLNNGEDHMGAAHLGESGFASALFYTYICIDRNLLIKNLGGDTELANKTLTALMEVAVKVSPEGKQNSYASRAYASYVRAEKGDEQPRSLAVAFLNPITGSNYGEDAIKALERTVENMNKVYELTDTKENVAILNTFTGEGKISELIEFIKE